MSSVALLRAAVGQAAGDARERKLMQGPDSMFTIHSYDNEVEAGHDRAFLEANGVATELSGAFHRELGPVRLMVRNADVEKSIELLRTIGRNVAL